MELERLEFDKTYKFRSGKGEGVVGIYLGRRKPYSDWNGKHMVAYRRGTEGASVLSFRNFTHEGEDVILRGAMNVALTKQQESMLSKRLRELGH